MKLIVQNIVLYVAYNGNLNSSENDTMLDIIDFNLHVTGYHKKCVLSNCILDKTHFNMETIKAIKPGPKPKKQNGTPDRRQRVTPDTKPKHPDLKPHKHKPGDSK